MVSRTISSWNTLSLAEARGRLASVSGQDRQLRFHLHRSGLRMFGNGPGARSWSAHILEQCSKVGTAERSEKLRQTVFRSGLTLSHTSPGGPPGGTGTQSGDL